VNEETGELEKAYRREFEFELPKMKLRAQCIRSVFLECSDSIPIILKCSALGSIARTR